MGPWQVDLLLMAAVTCTHLPTFFSMTMSSYQGLINMADWHQKNTLKEPSISKHKPTAACSCCGPHSNSLERALLFNLFKNAMKKDSLNYTPHFACAHMQTYACKHTDIQILHKPRYYRANVMGEKNYCVQERKQTHPLWIMFLQ